MVRVGEAIGQVLEVRKYSMAALLAGISFGLYQLFSTGTIYYDPSPSVLFAGATYPSIWVYRTLNLLGFLIPAWEVDLSSNLTLFLDPQAIILLVTESLLVAVNAALALFLFDQAHSCRTVDGRRRGILASLVSVVPGISMLGCCGGAFLSVLTALGAGVGLLQIVPTPYDLLLAVIPAVIMYLNILFMGSKVSSSTQVHLARGAGSEASV